MNVTVEKWGKGLGIKIPESVAISMGLKEGELFGIKCFRYPKMTES